MGMPISSAEVIGEAGEGVVGRMHIARVLTARREVGSVRQAFMQFLTRGAPGYVDRPRLKASEAIRLIHDSGGVAVIAHPSVVERESGESFLGPLAELASMGLDGIEAYYAAHTPLQTKAYLEMAKPHNLIATGGSDFHRPGNEGPELCSINARQRVPLHVLDDLKRVMAERRKDS
jgi:predicted metal-dependent phosphoesterase TrpH